MTELETAILRTITYFDIFNYPLTPWEIWKWLFGRDVVKQYSYRAVLQELQDSRTLQEKLSHQSGLFFLQGRAEIICTRQERYRLALLKLDRARAFTRVLRRLPFIRSVFACNSLGLANTRAESDIDFFIIAKRGHVWIVRLLAAGWAQLRHARPQPGNRQDTFCLSFFLADDSLALDSIRLPNDPYLTVWLATLVPLFDPDNLYVDLWHENFWVSKFLPNAQPRVATVSPHASLSFIARILCLVFGSQLVENFAARMQLRVLAPKLRVLANHDTRVVLTNRMLKFHDNDRRQAYAEAYAERARVIGVPL